MQYYNAPTYTHRQKCYLSPACIKLQFTKPHILLPLGTCFLCLILQRLNLRTCETMLVRSVQKLLCGPLSSSLPYSTEPSLDRVLHLHHAAQTRTVPDSNCSYELSFPSTTIILRGHPLSRCCYSTLGHSVRAGWSFRFRVFLPHRHLPIQAYFCDVASCMEYDPSRISHHYHHLHCIG